MADTQIASPAKFTEQGVLIAGGTSGVGLASAVQFAKAGVPHITLIGRNAERGEAARAKVQAAAPKAKVTFISADLNKLDAAERAVTQAHKSMGRIDTLLTCVHAGTVPVPLALQPPEEIAPMLNNQLLGVFYVCRFVTPIMNAQKSGSIILISSDAGKLATPGEAVMGGCMAAIMMFGRTLAMETKRDGLRVNVITPALISDTPSHEAVMSSEYGAKIFAKASKMAALGICTPDDMADTVLFLAGPASGRLTGQAISVNGGMSAA